MDTSQESLEFENAKLRFEKADLELNGTVLMLDKACSMYNYVKQYGVDKAFVRMHNEHSELDAMAKMVYPCTESFDSYPSDIAKYEQACMEGIMSGIKSAIDWVLKKLKQLGAFIADLVKKFINLFRHTEEDTKKEAALLAAAAENMSPGEEVKVEENSDNIIKTADKLNEKVQDIMDDDDKIRAAKDQVDQSLREIMQNTKRNQGTPAIGYTPDKKADKTTYDPDHDPDLYVDEVVERDLKMWLDWNKNLDPTKDHADIPNELKKICDEIAGSLEKVGKRTVVFRNKSDVIQFIYKGRISNQAALMMLNALDKSDKELHKLIDYYTKQLEEWSHYIGGYKIGKGGLIRIEYLKQCIKYMELIARRNMKVRSTLFVSIKSINYAYKQVRRAIEQTNNATRRMKIKTQ